MAPPFRVPLGVNLQSPLTSWPSRLVDTPPGTEGRLVVPFTIAWSEYPAAPGSTPCVMIDVGQAQGAQKITAIAAAWVDNSQSDADVFLLFNDLGTSIEIPARTTQLVPVSTSGLQFAISAPQATIGDLTNFQIFNFNPRWLSILPPYLVTPALTSLYDLQLAPAAQLVPLGTSGILTGIILRAFGVVGGAAQGVYQFAIADGSTPSLILINAGMSHATAGGPDDQTVLNAQGLNIRFKNGITLTAGITGTAFAAGSVMDIALTFR